jgi:hypothetical protein
MTTGSGWDGILAPGEKILWQGQPEPGIVWADALTSMMPGGAIFTVFATFWIVVSSGFTSGGDVSFPFSLFPLAGLPFLGVGLYMLGGHVILDAYLRSVTLPCPRNRRLGRAGRRTGRAARESFRSAGLAAAAGGVTTIVARPDTDPAIDTPEVLEFVRRRAAGASPVPIRHMAALTRGREGARWSRSAS